MRDRPSEAASRPGASGARSSRAVSAPRTIVASRSERLGREPELLDHHVEGAALAAMAPEHALDVERRGAEALGHRLDFRGATNRNTALGIDEAADQPGAGDAVDLGPRARDPDGAARRRRARAACRIGTSGRPACCQASKPPSRTLGGNARVAQPGGGALAELLAALADDDGGPPSSRRRPVGDCRRAGGGPTPGMSRGSAAKSSSVAHIDEDRAFRRADQARELVDGDGVDRRHGASSQLSGTRCFGMSPRGEIAFPMTGRKPRPAPPVKT